MDQEIKDMLSMMLNKFDKMDDKFDKMEERLDKMDKRFDKMEDRFNKIDDQFEGIEQRLDQVENNQQSMKDQMLENTRILKALEHAQEVHKADTDALLHRGSRVEEELKNVAENVKGIEANIDVLVVNTAKNMMDIVHLKKAR